MNINHRTEPEYEKRVMFIPNKQLCNSVNVEQNRDGEHNYL